jgi:hypothetical protein
MDELPTLLGLPVILADEAAHMEGWRLELTTGDLD